MSEEKSGGGKKKIRDKILNEIEQKDIQMKPACYFAFCSLLWLALAGLVFVISIILLTAGIYYLREFKFLGLMQYGYASSWAWAPLVVAIIAIGMILVSGKLYRKGRICCRHENWMLISALIFAALAGSFLLLREEIIAQNKEIIERNEYAQKFLIPAQDFWMNPGEGRIYGQIMEINRNNRNLIIQNKTDSGWLVYTGNCDCQINHQNAKIGKYIRVIGKKSEENVFLAKEVWYW